MADPLLFDIAEAILTAAADGMDDPPSRQVVVPGPSFAHDCDMLAVELQSMYPARLRQATGSDRPMARNEREVHTRQAQYQVTLVLNCIPGATQQLNSIALPSPAAITAAAERVMTAGFDARTAVRDEILAADSIFASCQHASCGDLVPFGPSGGVAGVRFPVLVELP